jgi:CysZ protein
MDDQPTEPPDRPGGLRRAAAGAWHVPAGIAFLVRNPGLWPLSAMPAVVAAMLLLGGLIAGIFAVSFADDWIAPPHERRGLGSLALALALYAALPVAGLLAGLAIALLLAAPILELLSRETERRLRGGVTEREAGWTWEIAQSLRGALYFLLRTPGVFLLSLVPVVGPLLGALWGAHALAFQMTESPLQRQGLDFWSRRMWHRANRAESLGFGLAGLATLLVPFANLLLAPALTVGATRLVLELEDQLRPSAEAADG